METKQEKRRIYLQKQVWLSDQEKSELNNLELIKQEWIDEVNKRFIEKPIEEKKEAPIISLGYIGHWFKKFWEFQNKKELIIHAGNKNIINALCMYFARDKRFETDFTGLSRATGQDFDLNKGIFLCGHVGTGKSSMFEAFRLLGENYHKEFNRHSLLFWKYNCRQIVSAYMDKSDTEGKNLKKYYKGTIPVYFDDLGAEEIAFNGGFNVMTDILENRYDNKSITFITTNLSLSKMKERYGQRVEDRLKEMFNIIPISGESFRK